MQCQSQMINLTNRSYYSFGYSPTSIENLVAHNKKLGRTSVGLIDVNLHGVVKLEKECKKENEEKGIKTCKAIRGLELSVKNQNTVSPIKVIAPTLDAFKNLTRLSNSAQAAFDCDNPTISLEQLRKGSTGLIGLLGGCLKTAIFKEEKVWKDYEEAKDAVKDTWKTELSALIDEYRAIFKDVYLEITGVDTPSNLVLDKALRYIAKQNNLKCVASPQTHYLEKKDAVDQRLLLCNVFQATLENIDEKATNEFKPFLSTSKFIDPTNLEVFTPEELKATLEIDEKCEKYSILSKPYLPKCSDNAVEELRQLCRKGWIDKVQPFVDEDKFPIYTERVKAELDVIEGAELSDYFLMVTDICKYADSKNILRGPGRGSAAGCLVSYLTDITKLDSIRFGLIFERFYNAGRNTKDKVSIPDIDLDFPTQRRDDILDYIRNKYHPSNVGGIVSFSRMMGRGGLRDVFRVHDVLSYDEINKITDNIPDEAKIADDLQEMEEEEGQSSIVMWSLIHRADKLKDYCILKDGQLEGPMAAHFAQAIRLQGTPKATSKHPSGIIVSNTSLLDNFPLSRDKSSADLLVALELEDAEAVGLVKLDILGISALDKIQSCLDLIKERK